MGATTRKTVDQTKSGDPENPDETWVSPDIQAAERGERVEMGKEFPEEILEEQDSGLVDEENVEVH